MYLVHMPNTYRIETVGPAGHTKLQIIGAGTAQRIVCECSDVIHTWATLREHIRVVVCDLRAAEDEARRARNRELADLEDAGIYGEAEEAYDEGRDMLAAETEAA